MNTDSFAFSFPMDIIKSENASTEEWRIGGYASTSDEDRQGDEILQKGLDISDFVNFGWLNFDHNNDIILGYPDKSKCVVDRKGFYVEGILLKGVEKSQRIWETALALKKSGSDRKLGFSVEGKILKRNDLGKIVKAKVYNVAVTPNPVNTSCTWDALVKSFTNDVHDIEKSLEAGHNDGSGSPIIPEDLESAFKTLSYTVGEDDESKLNKDKLKKKLSDKTNISKSELILYLQLTKGLSYDSSKIIADKLMVMEG